VTILEVIQRSAEFLGQRGVDSPRLQIELLLAHVLRVPRLRLYLNFERTLTEPELAQLRELVRRRAAREPLQHLLGSTSFCGLEFEVNRDVLIPRPETELLAERAWQQLSTFNLQPSTALDFGTGSGCLAVTIAVKCPAARVTALDISGAALTVARRNAARHGVGDRVSFVESDGFSALNGESLCDLVVANPPYIATDEIATLQPEVREFDPRPALDGGADGLDFYRRLAAEAGSFLSGHGKIMLEFGDGQTEAIKSLFEAQKWIVESVENDYTQRPRFLIASPARA